MLLCYQQLMYLYVNFVDSNRLVAYRVHYFIQKYFLSVILICYTLIYLINFSEFLHVRISRFLSRRSSIGTFIRPHSSEGSQQKAAKAPPPKLDYRSMVSIDDMPELFVSFDSKLYYAQKFCSFFTFIC